MLESAHHPERVVAQLEASLARREILQPDWSSWSHSLAFGADLPNEPLSFHLIMNAYWEPLDFELPPEGMASPWRRWIDTFLRSPEDIVDRRAARPVAGGSYRAGARSVVVLYRERDR